MRKLLAHRKRRSYIEGHGTIIYLPDHGIFGTYHTDEGMDMAEERGARRVIRELSCSNHSRKKRCVKQPELPGIPPRKPLVATLERVARNKRSDKS
jgi:hypothetical protein